MASDARILLVDDDKAVTQVVCSYLKKSGYDVSVANDFKSFEQLSKKGMFDLILLDLHMPDSHGLDIARSLRAESEQIGIIIVSGTEDDIDKVVGLELGADDFVSKPFDQRELLARIRTVLRRISVQARTMARGVVRFGEFELDLDSRELINDQGEDVRLTHHEFELLKLLVQRPNQVFSREQILRAVSGRDWIYSDRAVDVLVGKLRKKVELDPANPKYIKTVWGSGYKFTLKSERMEKPAA